MIFIIIITILAILAVVSACVVALINAKEREQQASEFRGIYGLADDTVIYYSSGVSAVSPMNPTKHEGILAKQVIDMGFFNRYSVFLDYYFRDDKGKTRQIDLLGVGKYGIFVFESKDFSGWIFGNGNQYKWTQTLGGEKYRFYNPVKQNNTHIQSLKTLIGKETQYYSMVVFGANATLKAISNIPQDTYVISSNNMVNILANIKSSQPECLTEEEIFRICKQINEKRLIYNETIRSEHINSIHELTANSKS